MLQGALLFAVCGRIVGDTFRRNILVAQASTRPIYGGDDFTKSYRFLDAPGGDPVDLSAWTFTCKWRSNANAEPFIMFTVDQSEANVGVITISATEEQTSSMSGPGRFDLHGVNGPTNWTFLWAKTTFQRGVTNG